MSLLALEIVMICFFYLEFRSLDDGSYNNLLQVSTFTNLFISYTKHACRMPQLEQAIANMSSSVEPSRYVQECVILKRHQ